MPQLTLRTLLAYIDDTLDPVLARQLGQKVAESELAQELTERIKKVTRRRGLKSPAPTGGHDDGVSDPNTVAEYLSDTLDPEQVTRLEETCLESDVHLAEVAACHQILTIILTEPVRVPPRARQRMYALVPPPASVPDRRPGKTLPVGGVVPAAADRAEPDDADTALLLGMRRYSGGSYLARLGLIGAAAALALFLVFAVMMALPKRPPEPPEMSTEFAAATTPAPSTPSTPPTSETPAGPKTEVTPLPVAPPPTPAEGKPAVKPPDKELVAGPAAPLPDRVPVGKLEGRNVLVVSRPDDGANWLRLDPAEAAGVTSGDEVLCLPGYKATVQHDTGVKVHLWGNVPDLLPARLLETRVRFHVPERKVGGNGAGFDADLTLLAGRVYLTTTAPDGARVRVRFAGEVWDVTLPDPKADVMVEVVTAFVPGTPFALKGGPPPQVEAQLAVVKGSATLTAPSRFKTFENVAAPAVVRWDNKSGTVTGPEPIEPGIGYYDKYLLVGASQGAVVQRALSDVAARAVDREGVAVLFAELLTEPADPARRVVTELAVYSQAAIASDPDGDDLKPLVDVLIEEIRGYARVAAVNALATWIAREPGNTALLGRQLAVKIRREGEPETILRLLRGYVSPANPDPAALDQLVEFLTSPSVAVRELALWNLINFVDRSAGANPDMVTDLAATEGPRYEKFVKAWKARVEEVKKAKPPKM